MLMSTIKTASKSTHLYGLSYWKIDETMLQATNSPNEAFLRSTKEITMEENIGDDVIKGIVQPFELGGETRLIRSDVKK